MEPLRIAMFTTFYPPYSFGGDAMGVQRLAAALTKRGHDVTVVHDIDAYLMKTGSEPKGATTHGDVKVIGLRSNLGVVSCFLTQQLGKPVVHGHRIRRLIEANAFDILWYHNASLVGGPGLFRMGSGLKVYEAHEHWLVCPTHVLWRHGRETCDARQCFRCLLHHRTPPQLWRYRKRFARDLDQVDVFIAKSSFSRDKHREFGFPKEMRVVPYFLPNENDQVPPPAERPHPRPYFLFVGRLEKIKGLDDVIPAFAGSPAADLLIIGDGNYDAALRQQAEGMDHVKFLGRLPSAQISTYYEHAIALIVPSICYETFGIILIESFRYGTPVLARRIGPFVDIVSRCGGGMLFSNQDELMEAMKTLQKDEAHRDRLSQAARAGFAAHWCEDAVMNDYFETLRTAALNKGNDRLARRLDPEPCN